MLEPRLAELRSSSAGRVLARLTRGVRQRASAASKPGPPVGLVEEFSESTVRGWVAVSATTEPVQVGLYLNSLCVATTYAAVRPPTINETDQNRHSGGEVRWFAFQVHDLWNFARTDGRVSVRIGPRPLPIQGSGTFYRPVRNGRRTMVELRGLLENGHVFTHEGLLQQSKTLDVDWQHRVLDLYHSVQRVLSEQFGLDCFLIYGTLLGAVRNGGIIGHDNDFDIAFISSYNVAAEAAEQIAQIGVALARTGLDVETRMTALHIHDERDRSIRIDLFHLYFDAAGELRFPFGIAGVSTFGKSDWTGLREIEFAGTTAQIPDAATKLVEHIYGPDWERPNPGFSWKRDRTAWDSDGWLPEQRRQRAYWSNFYANHRYTTPSTFCTHVLDRTDVPPLVFDIGCGEGRDARAFAAAGYQVTGMDRSEVAVETASAASVELAERLRFVACDVADSDAFITVVKDARAAAPHTPALFYLRFFLHSIPKDVQDALLTAISKIAEPGDLFAAEFRTTGDAKQKKAHGKHFRRFQSGVEFRARLENDFGFTVLEDAQGTGLSPYQDEDPELYRVIARRG